MKYQASIKEMGQKLDITGHELFSILEKWMACSKFKLAKTYILTSFMTIALFTKCKPYFPDIPEYIFQNLLLICPAIILARSTNLNVLKEYLPQLLEN